MAKKPIQLQMAEHKFYIESKVRYEDPAVTSRKNVRKLVESTREYDARLTAELKEAESIEPFTWGD